MKKISAMFALLLCCLHLSAEKVNDYKLQNGDKLQTVLEEHPTSAFVTFSWKEAANCQVLQLGDLPGLERFSACYRQKATWMVPATGQTISGIPNETQFLLADMGGQGYLMLFPLIDRTCRACLAGSPEGLKLIIDSGDFQTKVASMQALYLIQGEDPYQMYDQAVAEMAARLKTFRLRKEKPAPWFASHLGWCSWNAFYQKVSYDGVEQTLQNFQKNDIPVRWLLIDDGMQLANDKRQQISFEADPVKFPGGLKALTEMAKGKYGIRQILTWHNAIGFWNGVDPQIYGERAVRYVLPERYKNLSKKHPVQELSAADELAFGPAFYPTRLVDKYWNIPGPDFRDFYEPYYEFLSEQGIDGTKIDAMTHIEGFGNDGYGGRVKIMKEMLDGVGQAAALHFGGDYINCSSCSNDFLYNALVANVTRTSGDFFPKKPETHGFHVYTNAHTGFWMGGIILPDWDMFQSGHEAGPFHAAARAISGGPVYTTEEVGTENPELLKALVNEEGRLLLCEEPARIAKSSFFTDPAAGELAVNIWNRNRYSRVVGTFNCSYDKQKEVVVRAEVPYSDICPEEGKAYVVYDYLNDQLRPVEKGNSIRSTLKPLEFNIYTYAPVENGFAPVGTLGKLNMGAAVREMVTAGKCTWLRLLSGGDFLAWSAKRPAKILCKGEKLDFSYKNGRLEIAVPSGAGQEICLYWK